MANVSVKFDYKLKGLDNNEYHCFQKTYLSSHYAYSIERGDKGEHTDSIIYRGIIDNKNNTINYNASDCMLIINGGHSQTLELAYYSSDGTPYFFISTSANLDSNQYENQLGNDSSNVAFFGTKIGEVPYISGSAVDGNDIPNIYNLCYNLDNPTVSRADAGITPDKRHLIILARNLDGDTQFSLINVKRLLNEMGNGFSVDASQSDVTIDTFNINNFHQQLRYKSMQGVDMNNNYHIYIVGGDSHHQCITAGSWSLFKYGYWNDGNHFHYINNMEKEPEGIQTRDFSGTDIDYISFYTSKSHNYVYKIKEAHL